MNLDDSLENIDEIVDDIYVDTRVKKGLITRLFRNEPIEIKRQVNSETLVRLSNEIDLNIENLEIQVRKYNEIYKVISLYIKAISNYYNITLNVKEHLENKKLEYTDEELYFSELLEIQHLIDSLNNKLASYEKTRILMKQQLCTIVQTKTNHMIAKEALQSSKNDIIPIIGSEMLFKLGNVSQTNALELSNNLVALFKNVLTRNAAGTKRSLEMLKEANLPQEAVDKIMTDFSGFLEKIDISDENTDDKPKVLIKGDKHVK